MFTHYLSTCLYLINVGPQKIRSSLLQNRNFILHAATTLSINPAEIA
jgi:hypothetical protein